jgi:hypothetical protein
MLCEMNKTVNKKTNNKNGNSEKEDNLVIQTCIYNYKQVNNSAKSGTTSQV